MATAGRAGYAAWCLPQGLCVHLVHRKQARGRAHTPRLARHCSSSCPSFTSPPPVLRLLPHLLSCALSTCTAWGVHLPKPPCGSRVLRQGHGRGLTAPLPSCARGQQHPALCPLARQIPAAPAQCPETEVSAGNRCFKALASQRPRQRVLAALSSALVFPGPEGVRGAPGPSAQLLSGLGEPEAPGQHAHPEWNPLPLAPPQPAQLCWRLSETKPLPCAPTLSSTLPVGSRGPAAHAVDWPAERVLDVRGLSRPF